MYTQRLFKGIKRDDTAATYLFLGPICLEVATNDSTYDWFSVYDQRLDLVHEWSDVQRQTSWAPKA